VQEASIANDRDARLPHQRPTAARAIAGRRARATSINGVIQW
jgi:hypothetical protein